MDLLDFATRLKLLIEDLNASREEDSIKVAVDLSAGIRKRVSNDKVNADGTPFGQYSNALLPRWFFYGKSRTNGADQKVRSGNYFLSYAEFREINGLQSGDIDFLFTGEMWKNTGVVLVENNTDTCLVQIGGQTQRSQDILKWQEPKHGNIIEPSEKEINDVRSAHLERVNNKINLYLG